MGRQARGTEGGLRQPPTYSRRPRQGATPPAGHDAGTSLRTWPGNRRHAAGLPSRSGEHPEAVPRSLCGSEPGAPAALEIRPWDSSEFPGRPRCANRGSNRASVGPLEARNGRSRPDCSYGPASPVPARPALTFAPLPRRLRNLPFCHGLLGLCCVRSGASSKKFMIPCLPMGTDSCKASRTAQLPSSTQPLVDLSAVGTRLPPRLYPPSPFASPYAWSCNSATPSSRAAF